jgi:hypothetical protein
VIEIWDHWKRARGRRDLTARCLNFEMVGLPPGVLNLMLSVRVMAVVGLLHVYDSNSDYPLLIFNELSHMTSSLFTSAK